MIKGEIAVRGGCVGSGKLEDTNYLSGQQTTFHEQFKVCLIFHLGG